MSYDLFVWPVDHAVTAEEAARQLNEWVDDDRGVPRDARLIAFCSAVTAGRPWLTGAAEPRPGEPLFEFSSGPNHAAFSLGWDALKVATEIIQPAAEEHGLLVFDPQTMQVALPPDLGGAGLDMEAAAPHVEQFERFVDVLEGLGQDAGADPTAVLRGLRDMGMHFESPFGYEITPDLLAESFSDPGRLSKSVQTADRKKKALADLASPKPARRMRGLMQLAAWDPDPTVTIALRPILSSPDDTERTFATIGLARQQDVASLEPILALTKLAYERRTGDLFGGTSPAKAALDLAAVVGPEEVARVRQLIAEWGGPKPGEQLPWEFDRSEWEPRV